MPNNLNTKQNNTIEIAQHLGKTIKNIRLKNKLTIADVSNLSGVSRGMLSKIENAQSATSLETLVQVANALGVSISTLFQGYDNYGSNAQHIKKGQGMEVVRLGTKCGHMYNLLAYNHGPTKVFEPFLLTLDDESETFPTFEHPGTEFIYMLAGEMEYQHGDKHYLLQPGDSLTFSGEVAHGPKNLIKCPIRFLSIMIYPNES